MEALKNFITANGKNCESCRWCNHENFDCVHPSGKRTITNKLDFGTYNAYPISSAVRTHGGNCKPEAVLFEPRS